MAKNTALWLALLVVAVLGLSPVNADPSAFYVYAGADNETGEPVGYGNEAFGGAGNACSDVYTKAGTENYFDSQMYCTPAAYIDCGDNAPCCANAYRATGLNPCAELVGAGDFVDFLMLNAVPVNNSVNVHALTTWFNGTVYALWDNSTPVTLFIDGVNVSTQIKANGTVFSYAGTVGAGTHSYIYGYEDYGGNPYNMSALNFQLTDYTTKTVGTISSLYKFTTGTTTDVWLNMTPTNPSMSYIGCRRYLSGSAMATSYVANASVMSYQATLGHGAYSVLWSCNNSDGTYSNTTLYVFNVRQVFSTDDLNQTGAQVSGFMTNTSQPLGNFIINIGLALAIIALIAAIVMLAKNTIGGLKL